MQAGGGQIGPIVIHPLALEMNSATQEVRAQVLLVPLG